MRRSCDTFGGGRSVQSLGWWRWWCVSEKTTTQGFTQFVACLGVAARVGAVNPFSIARRRIFPTIHEFNLLAKWKRGAGAENCRPGRYEILPHVCVNNRRVLVAGEEEGEGERSGKSGSLWTSDFSFHILVLVVHIWPRYHPQHCWRIYLFRHFRSRATCGKDTRSRGSVRF